MGEKALWPMVSVVAIVCTMLTLMVISGVNILSLVAVIGVLFTGVSSLIGVILYGKMVKVEQNVNGNTSADKALILDLIAALKKAPPIKSE